MAKLGVVPLALLVYLMYWQPVASQNPDGSTDGLADGSATVNVVININDKKETFAVPAGLVDFITELTREIIRGLPGSKIDIIECESDPEVHGCNATSETCVNFGVDEGNFLCACNSGLIRLETGSQCVPDLCAAQNTTCNNIEEQCNNDESDLQCECAPGFHLNETTGNCSISASCFPNKCTAQSSCFETSDGGFNCTCRNGFAAAGNGVKEDLICNDIDECADDNLNDCSKEFGTCNNQPGNYTCVCNDGFEGDGATCEDTDECSDASSCHADASCTNTIGSHTCVCKTGYSGNGMECKDIDECNVGTHNCSSNADCNNSQPGFSCECKGGYTGDGFSCDDIDECADDNLNDCSKEFSTCDNQRGSYTCVCNNGFEKNGATCEDIDECTTGKHDCADPGGNCTNTEGSFGCECQPESGYQGNGKFCALETESIIATFTATQSTRRKRSPADFASTIENVIETLLGNGTDITVDLLGKNSTGGTTAYDLLISANPTVKSVLLNILPTLMGRTFDGFTLEEILYPVTVSFKGSVGSNGKNETEVCDELIEYVRNNISDTPSANNATIDCVGVKTGDTVKFDLTVEGAFAGEVDLSQIFRSYPDVIEDAPVCDENSCGEGANCTVENSAILCRCDASYYDANLADPGQSCESPIRSIECAAESIKVKLYAAYFLRITLDPTSIHLRDPSCKGTVDDGFLIFDEKFSECGGEQKLVEDRLVYSNEVTNINNGLQVHKTSVQFSISCSYPTEIESSADENNPVIPTVSATLLIQSATGEGVLEVTMTVYTDSEFSQPLTVGSDELEIGELLYIQVSHSASSSENYLKLRECWITSTNDKDSEERQAIITNSCPVSDPALVKIISNGRIERALYEMKVTSFSGSNKIYSHCDVDVCAKPCEPVCPVVSGRRRRRNVDGRNVLSVGPIPVANNAAVQAAAPSNTTAIVIGCISGVLLVVCAVFLVRKFRNRQASHTSFRMKNMGYDNFLSHKTDENCDDAYGNIRR